MPRQALSPCRGSDLGIRDSGHRHREPAPTEPAAATARCGVSPDPHRLARTLTARSRPRLRRRLRRSPSSSSVTTRLPLATTQATSCPDWNKSFTAVRITRMAPSRSPRRACSPAAIASVDGTGYKRIRSRSQVLRTFTQSGHPADPFYPNGVCRHGCCPVAETRSLVAEM